MMKRKSTSKKPSHFSLSQGKVLWFMLLFLAQNVLAQITLSEGTTFYSDQTDSLSLGKQNISKIYISSGVQIYSKNADLKYEVEEIVDVKNIKSTPRKQLAANFGKETLDKVVTEIIDQIEERIILTQESIGISKSTFSFTFIGNFSKITVPILHYSSNQIINSENYRIFLVFGWTDMLATYFKSTELFAAENKSAFSVRPPPFLA